jgi:hypothetical protein
LKWTSPSNGGHKITAYKVEVQTYQKDVFSGQGLKCGEDPTATECTVMTEILQNGPYKLSTGEQYTFRIAAVNKLGIG